MSDDHHLLTRYRRNVDHARTLTNITLEEQRPVTEAKHTMPAGGEAHQLAGIPVIGYGIPTGAINGTRPDTLPFLTPSERTA